MREFAVELRSEGSSVLASPAARGLLFRLAMTRALTKQTTPVPTSAEVLPQSAAKRRRRLADGRCPVHGQYLHLQSVAPSEAVFASCPLRGCIVRAWLQDGTLKLEPHLAFFLDENWVDDAEALESLARRVRAGRRRIAEQARTAVLHELGDDVEEGPPSSLDQRGDRQSHAA